MNGRRCFHLCMLEDSESHLQTGHWPVVYALQVQTSVDVKEILWIKESHQYGEHPPDSPTTAARKHTRERLAERARRSDSDYSDLESQSLPASELKRQTKSFQLTLDTIRTGESHTETGALTAEEKLRRRQAILICADLVSSIVEDALRAAQRKKSLAWKLLPRDFLSGASLRQTYTWPDRTRYEERTLFLFPLSHPIRLAAIAVSEHQSWQLLFSMVVLLSCILITLEDPFEQGESR